MKKYCPFCKRDIEPINIEEIESLIYEYKEKITKIEELQEELEELKEGK